MENYIAALKSLFAANANEENAAAMQAYMRDRFEFYGIKQPQRKALGQHFFKANGYPAVDDFAEFMQLLWAEPQRELQYVGLDIVEKYIKKMPEEAIDLYEYLIVNQSWWDTVDMLASKAVGGHLLRFPELTAAVNQHFLTHDNLWLNRTAIIFQLKYKTKTDTNLLGNNILYWAHHKDFFIQKAIGWALREYSKTDADFVRAFVENHELAPLSRREAVKLLITN